MSRLTEKQDWNPKPLDSCFFWTVTELQRSTTLSLWTESEEKPLITKMHLFWSSNLDGWLPWSHSDLTLAASFSGEPLHVSIKCCCYVKSLMLRWKKEVLVCVAVSLRLCLLIPPHCFNTDSDAVLLSEPCRPEPHVWAWTGAVPWRLGECHHRQNPGNWGVIAFSGQRWVRLL